MHEKGQLSDEKDSFKLPIKLISKLYCELNKYIACEGHYSITKPYQNGCLTSHEVVYTIFGYF